MMLRKSVLVGVGTVAALAMTAGPASAHYCYFDEPNVIASANRGETPAFMPFGELAAMFTGLCPEGIQILADAAGVSTDTVINVKGTMAGGLAKQGKDNKAISHLDFAAIGAAEPGAFEACGMEYPPPAP